MDWYIGAIGVMLIALLECLVVAWVYGATRFRKEIAMMTGTMPSVIWEVFWRGISPVVIFVALIVGLQGYGNPTYGDYSYPQHVITIGWILASLSVIPIPLYMIYILYHTEGSFVERVKKQLRPSKEWGPWLDDYRDEYDHLTGPLQPTEYYVKMASLKRKGEKKDDTEKELLKSVESIELKNVV